MTALAHEVIPVVEDEPVSVDEILWETWKALELPEGYRAEIIEGAIEVSPTGRRRHMVLINRLRRALEAHLGDGEHIVWHDGNVIHRPKGWVPDLFIAPSDVDEISDEDDLGVDAVHVSVVFEVVSPGRQNIERDRVRKRREYARAGIPVYVIVDDFDEGGAVLVLTSPNRRKGAYVDEHRVLYGTDVVIPFGPAQGFTIGEAITRR